MGDDTAVWTVPGKSDKTRSNVFGPRVGWVTCWTRQCVALISSKNSPAIVALSNIVLVSSSSSNNRHSLFRWDCSFCSFSLRLPSPLWSFHNLEPSKLEGCRLALRRCVEARCQDVECLSTLYIVSSYSY